MVSIGAQWVVLQSAAWVGMAVSYSIKAGSLTEGLSETFDGQHPCPMCKLVDQGKKSEKKAPVEHATKLKLDLFSQPRAIFVVVPFEQHFAPAENEAALRRHISPPVPPPRGVAAAA